MTFEFHAGELELQSRTGVREIASRVATGIHPVIPAAVEAFLEEQRFIVLAAADARDRPWASVLAGPAGFARRLNEHILRIDAVPAQDDPLAMNLRTGSLAGILIPDLATRRRLRVNGRLEVVDGAILIHVDQAYSNCPKYIQLREPAEKPAAMRPRIVGHASALMPHDRVWVRDADTFFIATMVPGEGADASHRGGMPGFVKVDGQELTWPDYPGNSMFNSLGNIVKYPYTGILVPDFKTGSTLQMTGRATIEPDPERSSPEAREKLRVRFTPDELIQMDDVLPERLRLIEYSSFNLVSPNS
jgi:predicted pyridoxine 5'-phosphate oxidase superfamily flavin-nucleotide-binding protein